MNELTCDKRERAGDEALACPAKTCCDCGENENDALFMLAPEGANALTFTMDATQSVTRMLELILISFDTTIRLTG